MYKLLLADDEPLILQSMKEDYDWKSHGLQVVSVCRNGLDVLDSVTDLAPDLILTDVVMPKLTGLEMIERLQAMKIESEIIILSGYSEFEYARKAMSLGVRHYLTKPLEEAKLWAAVEQSIQEHERREENKRMRNLAQTIFLPQQSEDKTVSQIREYVKSHLSDSDLSMSYLANHVLFMNVDYLSHLFSVKTGKRFSAYLNEARMTMAAELLANSPKAVYQVAESVGMGGNPGYFGQLFKKHTGMTPSDFAEQYKKTKFFKTENKEK